MMHNWFVSKIRYEKTMENGMVKRVTEPYLVDGLSFTEAEARTFEMLQPVSGEFLISDISRAKYAEVVFSNDSKADRWFNARVAFITLDEHSGSEKKAKSNILIQAADFDSAKSGIVEHMKGTMSDYVIDKIEETPIMDCFPYDCADNSEK